MMAPLVEDAIPMYESAQVPASLPGESCALRSGRRYAIGSTGSAIVCQRLDWINHEYVLLEVQRGHVLRSRS